MADNTVLNAGAGGDTVRDLARQAGAVKTQVMQLDIGGASANAEVLVTAGQRAMSGSMPVVLASDQPSIGVVSGAANDAWGQALAVTASATATVVSIASSAAGFRIMGLIGHGTGDGYFTVQINAATVFSGRTRATLPTLVISLPNGIAPAAGSAVTLKVTNESGSTADFDGTLLGS